MAVMKKIRPVATTNQKGADTPWYIILTAGKPAHCFQDCIDYIWLCL